MPAYELLLSQPPIESTPERQQAFERLFQATPVGGLIDYQLPYPKWQYLSWLCETKELVLHGSQNLGIDTVEPQQARDIKAFSKQDAIYATTNGIWVIYFAIIDRKNFPGLSLFNSCLQVRIAADQWSEPFYFFSISQFARIQNPWCEGMVYILPRQTFEQEVAVSRFDAAGAAVDQAIPATRRPTAAGARRLPPAGPEAPAAPPASGPGRRSPAAPPSPALVSGLTVSHHPGHYQHIAILEFTKGMSSFPFKVVNTRRHSAA